MTSPDSNTSQGELFPTDEGESSGAIDQVETVTPERPEGTVSQKRPYWEYEDERQRRINDSRGEDLGSEQTGFPNPRMTKDIILPPGTTPQIGDTMVPGRPGLFRHDRADFEKERAVRQGRAAVGLAQGRWKEHLKEVESRTLDVPDVLGDELVFSSPFFKALNLDTIQAEVDWVADNTPEDYQHSKPEFIDKAIRTSFNQSTRRSIEGLVFNNGEFWNTVRSPHAYTSKKAYELSTSQEIKDLPISERGSAVRHALSGAMDKKTNKMGDIMDRLKGELKTLERATKLLNLPAFEGSGYSRMSSEEIAPTVRAALEIFKNMLDVARVRYQWTGEEHGGAMKAMIERLFTGKPEAKRDYWNQLLAVATIYDRNKFSVVKRRQRLNIEHKQSLGLESN